jgi:hypothetical protein
MNNFILNVNPELIAGEFLVWLVIGLAAAAVLTAIIYFAVKFFKMTADERKELLVQFLIGLVTVVEPMFEKSGAGAEKVKWVEEQFNKTAPWFLKMVLSLTKTANLHDLIDKALEKAKSTVWDKNKK